MTAGKAPLRVIVLAGQRRGQVNPLAERFGISHKCLVPLGGKPLIGHVLNTLAEHPEVESLALCVEQEAFEGIFDVLSQLPGRGVATLVEARETLTDSVIAAAGDWDGPILITTADHALLTAGSVDRMLEALERCDVAIAMAPRDAVLAAHPQGQRRFYGFADGEFSNCNLYGLAGRHALDAAEVFRGGGQFAKSALRIIRAFGLFNLLLLRFKAVTLDDAMDRIGRRLKLRLRAVVLDDGSQAIDVDNDRTYAIVRDLLNERPEIEGPAPAEANEPAALRRA